MLAGFAYRKIITIDHMKVEETLTGFVLPVVLTSSNFQFNAAKPDGTDIRFTDGEDNLLDFERVFHDSVNKIAEYQVACPTLTTLADVVVYMPYGNPSADDAATQEATWDDNFVAVYHMNDGVDNAHITDSTQYDNDGTKKGANEPVQAAGKVGYAQTFDASDDYIDCGQDASLNFGSSSFTISFLINPSSVTDTGVLQKGRPGSHGGVGMQINMRTYSGLSINLKDDIENAVAIDVGLPFSTGVYSHGALVIDRVAGTATLFINGAQSLSAIDISSITGSLDVAEDFYIGYRNGSIFAGLFDELRVSDTIRSAAWIKAESYAALGTLGTMTDDWGIDTLNQCRFLLGVLPYADGTLTRQDAQHLLGIFPALNPSISVGGNLTFNGTLGRNISRGVGGNLTFNGVLDRYTFRDLGGNLTFNGILTPAHVEVVTIGGDLTFNGVLQAQNPDWLLLPSYLNWMGLWDSGTTYAEGDAVLFVDGTLHHAFASKKGSNLNHSPNDSAWWYRVMQEGWSKV
ncbi:MAG: LamG-like jellyroll fold domain-containing protein [Patescibacteria group bacterium]